MVLDNARLNAQEADLEGTQDFDDNGSQFNTCVDDSSGLDRTYTLLGEVFRGMEVVDKIVAAPRDEFDNPLVPVTMKMTVKE